MERRTAYNAATIYKIVLIPEEESRYWAWTKERQRWGGFLGCSIKEFEAKEFAWFDRGCGRFFFSEDAITSHEEFLEKNPNYKIINNKEGGPVAVYKAHVNVEFVNGKIHTEWFDTDEQAEQYFNRITGMRGQVPFEFDVFR